MLIAFALAVLALLAAILWFGVHSKSAKVFGRSVYRGHGRRRTVALTFDDGPSPNTLALAKYLVEHGVRATFFQCGANVARHPGVGRELLKMGHEIGNHTYSHLRMPPRLGWQLHLVSPRRIYEELSSTQVLIEQDAGIQPIWFRAPYGMRWFGLAGALRQLKLTGVMWTVIAHDWEWTTQDVVDHVLRKTKPGGIVCMHDGRDIRPDPDIWVTLEAVRMIVPELIRRGYAFETVTDILR